MMVYKGYTDTLLITIDRGLVAISCMFVVLEARHNIPLQALFLKGRNIDNELFSGDTKN